MIKIKYLWSWICIFIISMSCQAQNIKSYAATSVMGTTGPQAVPTLAITIEYHDGYFLLNGVEKYIYRTKNYDGSMQYYPAVVGNPTLRTTGILVSKDYSYVRQFTESIMMGMKMELVYDYSYIGDGYEAAQNYMGFSNGSYSGGHSHSNSSRDWADCSICNGTGRCKNCGGSGRDAYTRDGRCGVCRGTGKCAGCNGKRGYYY